jgi:hypothetical protein
MFYREYKSIPSNLDDLQPGPELGGVLACIDVDDISPYDRIILLRAQQRQRSFADAQLYRTMASIADALDDDHPRYGTDAAAAEIRVALRLTRRATDNELSFALELQRRLSQVWEALVTGVIDVRRAQTIIRATGHLSAAVAQGVVERIIEAAPHLTTGELKARLERIVIEADPDAARQRYEYAVKDRRLIVESTTDGTANLLGLGLPPHRVNAASRRINHLARSLKTKGETRSMDQLRADVYLDLLQGTTTSDGNGKAAAGGVHLSSGLDTLVGLAAHPGELNGYGPVIADIARQVAAQQEDAEWRWSVTHPATGEVIHDGITQRRPTTALRRRVEARDQTCVFPGCRMPAVDCDLDHMKRWADGGPTTERNLAPACRHDNLLKERHHWTCRRLPNGDYQWTSRLGHTYTTNRKPP